MANHPASKAPRAVTASAVASEAARRGHPWIWQRGIVRGLEGAVAGEEVRVVGDDKVLIGHGLADPGSPIVVRMWTRGEQRLDTSLFEERIARAIAIRARIFADGRTTAYRLLHGEGDRMPGFVVDRYGRAAVLRVDGEAARIREEEIARALWPALERLGIESLVARDPRSTARLLRGPMPPDRVDVLEHGVPFVVDLLRGQKTGAFLDQRENRRRVGELARGRTVLNLFSYAGGFSLHAALGGADKVTSVDIAGQAHAAAQASFRLAEVDPNLHDFVAADAFVFLEQAKKKMTKWDLVISDPPSFAPNEKAVPRAITAYRNLHRACADVLAPGGIFCAASCSSHIDARAFASSLDDAALGTSELRLLEMFGPPPDHPTLPAWPEGRYLKFAVLA
ncbi:MAG: m5C1962 methyltransferase RlmI [Myxococcaceae bacterium]|nr:m5C1962 methyltransferase RlmI [Myxococcaceae bacterium]